MRTKEQIKELLNKSLNSPIWKNLKRGILGRELIEYGATVVHHNELSYDTFYRNLFSDTADLKGCINLGKVHEVPFNDFTPAYIKLRLPSDRPRVYQPFSIVLTAGALKYTNIHYIRTESSNIVTLYQGNVKCVTNAPLQDLGFKNVEPQPIVEYKLDLDPEETVVYHKLSKTALFESVLPFRITHLISPFTPLSPLNESPDTYNYRLMKGDDNYLNIYYSDGIRGKQYTGEDIAIYYLDCTFNKYRNVQRVLTTDFVEDFPINDEDIISEFSGSPSSIIQARKTLKANITLNTVIATEDQIKNFIRSYPNIIDTNVVLSNQTNHLHCYVKPRVSSDVYDDIEENLRLHGELVTTYEIIEGIGVSLDIVLESHQRVTEEEKSKTVDYLLNKLSYESLDYKTNLSIGYITTLIGDVISKTTNVSMRYQQLIVDDYTKLAIHPQKGTIRIVNNDNLIGWDFDGYIYAHTTDVTLDLNNLFKFGDFFISSDESITKVYNSNLSNVVYANASDMRIGNVQNYKKYKNLLIVQTEEEEHQYRVFEIGRSFKEGSMSVMSSVNPVVSPILPNNFNEFITSETPSLLDNAILLNKGVFKIFSDNGVWNTALYRISPDSLTWNRSYLLNFNLNVSSTSDITALFSVENYIIVSFSSGLESYVIDMENNEAQSVIPLDLYNTEFLPQDEVLKCICAEESIYSITSKTVEDETHYRLYWASDVSVIYGSTSHLLPIGGLRRIYEATEEITVLEALRSSITFKIGNEILKWTPTGTFIIAKEGSRAKQLQYSGSVSYSDRTINFENVNLLVGSILQFESVENLANMDDRNYPVVNKIEWNDKV